MGVGHGKVMEFKNHGHSGNPGLKTYFYQQQNPLHLLSAVAALDYLVVSVL